MSSDESSLLDAQVLPPTLSTQLPSFTSAKFHSSAASRLMLYAGDIDANEQQTQQQQGTTMFDFQWDVYVGQLHPLLHGWHAIFCQVQSSAVSMSPRSNPLADRDAWITYILQASRRYRAELEATLVAAAQQIRGGAGFEQPRLELEQELNERNIAMDDYKFQLLLLETCKSLFHLLEIFYLDPHLNLTSQLIDWIHRTLQMPVVEPSEEEEEEGDFDPAIMKDSESYWNCLYRLLLQGRLYEALQMLQSCQDLVGRTSVYRGLMEQIMNCIQTVPAIAWRPSVTASASSSSEQDDRNNVPLEQFIQAFKSWQGEVQALLDSDVLQEHPHPHLELLLSVLIGDESSLLNCAQSNYLEYFIATLIFVKPHVQNSKQQLAAILQKCMEECESLWRDQRLAEREALEEENGGSSDGLEEFNPDESLYSPIDTLRFHLVSSDITSALNVMNSMIDLRFFMAHVVFLLDAHGEILHLETGKNDSAYDLQNTAQPLRIAHSSYGDNITLKEYYLLSFGENLESAASSAHTTLFNAGPNSDLWALAADVYAACYEFGEGFLSNLLRKQSVVLSLTGNASTQGQSSAFDQGRAGAVQQPQLQTKKVQKLLSIATKYSMKKEYNEIVARVGDMCARWGLEALANATGAQSSWIGQACFYYFLLQPVSSASTKSGVSLLAVERVEKLAEQVLDRLLLSSASNSSPIPQQQLEKILHAIAGILSFTPSSLILPAQQLEAEVGAQNVVPKLLSSQCSPLLSFLSAYYSFELLQKKSRQLQADLAHERERAVNYESGADAQYHHASEASHDQEMEDVAAPAAAAAASTVGAQNPFTASSAFSQLLSMHATLFRERLSLLLVLLRNMPLLLAQQKKYWMCLFKTFIRLTETRTPSIDNNSHSNVSNKKSIVAVNWMEVQQESLLNIASEESLHSTPLASLMLSQLSLSTLTQLQSLFASVRHSVAVGEYEKLIGGPKEVEQIQQRLNKLAQQCMLKRVA